MAPYEALYGRPYRFPVCWTEVGERRWNRYESVFSRLRADRRATLTNGVGDHVSLKVMPKR